MKAKIQVGLEVLFHQLFGDIAVMRPDGFTDLMVLVNEKAGDYINHRLPKQDR